MTTAIPRYSRDWSDDEIQDAAGDDPQTAFMLGGLRYADKKKPRTRRQYVGDSGAIGELLKRSNQDEALHADGDATADDRTVYNRAADDGERRANGRDPTLDLEEIPDEREWRRLRQQKQAARWGERDRAACDAVSRSYWPGTAEWRERKAREGSLWMRGLCPWYSGPFGPEPPAILSIRGKVA